MYLLISYHYFAPKSGRKSGKISGRKIRLLYNFYLALKACKTLLFPIHRSFIVDVHCRGNIGMTHDFLNDLDVSFVLTEPRTECVSELVY